MSSKKTSPEDRVTCPTCSAVVSRRNYSRHRRDVHNDTASDRRSLDDLQSRSRSNSNETITSGISTCDREVQSSLEEGCSQDPTTYLLSEVAKAILEQHHLTSEEQLRNFVHHHYPEIPKSQTKALVVGAITGAQRAASFHFVVERNHQSNDPAKREMAFNAGSSISFWNLGLQLPPRSIPNQPTISPTQENSTKDSNNLHPVRDLTTLQLPVSFDQSCRDLDLVRAAAVEAGLANDNGEHETPTSTPGVLTQVPAAVSSSVQPTVEPYVPELRITAQPLPDVRYVPTALNKLPRDEPVPIELNNIEDTVLEIDINSVDFEPLLQEPEEGSRSATQATNHVPVDDSTSKKSSESKPADGAHKQESASALRKYVDKSTRLDSRVHTVSRVHATHHRTPTRERVPRPRSRTPRRQGSPPRRLVLSGPDLRDFLDFQKNRTHHLSKKSRR